MPGRKSITPVAAIFSALLSTSASALDTGKLATKIYASLECESLDVSSDIESTRLIQTALEDARVLFSAINAGAKWNFIFPFSDPLADTARLAETTGSIDFSIGNLRGNIRRNIMEDVEFEHSQTARKKETIRLSMYDSKNCGAL